MKSIYRHHKNGYKFELVAIVLAKEVEQEIARRKERDAALVAAGWQAVEVEYRVGK